jgi:hypothetical protein
MELGWEGMLREDRNYVSTWLLHYFLRHADLTEVTAQNSQNVFSAWLLLGCGKKIRRALQYTWWIGVDSEERKNKKSDSCILWTHRSSSTERKNNNGDVTGYIWFGTLEPLPHSRGLLKRLTFLGQLSNIIEYRNIEGLRSITEISERHMVFLKDLTLRIRNENYTSATAAVHSYKDAKAMKALTTTATTLLPASLIAVRTLSLSWESTK